MMSPNDPTHSASEPHAHHAATVRLSLSEINALCFKAARGAGLDWGEAEEAGWAAAWLTRAGMAGPHVILAWLEDCAALARPVPAPARWVRRDRAHCPLRTGIALADFAGLPEGPGTRALTVDSIAHPLVALPFLARAAGRLDLGLSIGWGDGNVLLDAELRMSPSDIPQGDHREAVDMAITPADAPAPQAVSHQGAGPLTAVALADWQALDVLALRITVPPSPRSRAGAGAAGDDND